MFPCPILTHRMTGIRLERHGRAVSATRQGRGMKRTRSGACLLGHLVQRAKKDVVPFDIQHDWQVSGMIRRAWCGCRQSGSAGFSTASRRRNHVRSIQDADAIRGLAIPSAPRGLSQPVDMPRPTVCVRGGETRHRSLPGQDRRTAPSQDRKSPVPAVPLWRG